MDWPETYGEGLTVFSRSAFNRIRENFFLSAVLILGGGYFYPMLEPHVYFLDYVRRELEKKGTTVGVATLAYSELNSRHVC